MRRLNEVAHKRQEDAVWLDPKYVFIFDGHEEYRWSYFRHLSDEEILPHLRNKVFPFLKPAFSELVY